MPELRRAARQVHASRGGPVTNPATEVGRRIAERYRAIGEASMAGLAVCNPALGVAEVGFRTQDGRAVGIVVTPWFMNVVAAELPGGAPLPAATIGALVTLALPGGALEMIVGALPEFGRLDACSLYSPMQNFADMDAAVATAHAAIGELFAPPANSTVDAVVCDRRAVLRGRFGAATPAR